MGVAYQSPTSSTRHRGSELRYYSDGVEETTALLGRSNSLVIAGLKGERVSGILY